MFSLHFPAALLRLTLQDSAEHVPGHSCNEKELSKLEEGGESISPLLNLFVNITFPFDSA